MSSDLAKTPLHDWHVQRGARMVDFGGWSMPIQFDGIISEHHAVRRRAGLFDVSHMGEVRVRGARALDFVQRLITNDAGGLETGQAQYTVMTGVDGGIIDDLLVYKLAADDYLLVVNAATTSKDVAWIEEQAGDEGGVEIEDESGRWAQLAVQGPAAERVLDRVIDAKLADIGYYRSIRTEWRGREALVSRTGYTGEDGFEAYVPAELATALADAVMDAGEPEGIVPAGLGARDTLRLEAGMLLYGNDMDESRSPIEAGLRWLVKPDKGEFVGRRALVEQIEQGTEERLVGFELLERGVPRHGYTIHPAGGGEPIGTVTSGSFSPTLEKGIGLAYLPAADTAPGTRIEIAARRRRLGAEVVKTPFYKRERQADP